MPSTWGIGTTELTGTMQVAVQKQRPNEAVSRAAGTAASTVHVGGKGKGVNNVTGKGKGGKGTATMQQGAQAYQRPKCLDGSQCKGYGTLEGCSKEHEALDMAMMQEALGSDFISHSMRLRLLPILKKHLPRPTATPTVTSQLSNALTAIKAAQSQGQSSGADEASKSALASPIERAAALQAKLQAVIAAHPQDQDRSGAAVQRPDFALCSLPIMQSRVSSDTNLSDQRQSMAYDMLLAENARLRTVITMLAACGHHAIPSTNLSHAVSSLPSQSPCEQPVSAATSLMPAAYTESVNMPARTIADPNTIMMPLINAAALTPTIRAIPMATGPKRPMRAHHKASRAAGEWTSATEPTTMGVSRTVREQARIERAAQIAESNERMQPHFRYPYSLP